MTYSLNNASDQFDVFQMLSNTNTNTTTHSTITHSIIETAIQKSGKQLFDFVELNFASCVS